MMDHIQALEENLNEARTAQEQIERRHELARALVHANPERAQKLVDEAREMATTGEFAAHPYEMGLADNMVISANLAADRGDYHAANRCLEEALPILENNGQIARVGGVYSTLAFNLTRLGSHSRALDYGMKSVKIAEEAGDDARLAAALNALAAIFSNLNEHEQSLSYYERCRNLYEKMENYRGISTSLNNIAYTHLRAGNYEQTTEYAHMGLDLADQQEEMDVRGTLYLRNNAAHAYRMLGQDEDALRLYRENMDYLAQQDDKIVRLANLLGTGLIYTGQGRKDEALITLEAALALGELTRAQPFYYECHQALADLHQQNGQYEQALHHFQQFHTLKEAATDETARKLATQMEFQYQEEAARREAELYHEQNLMLEEEISRRNAAEETLQAFLEKQQALMEINFAISRAKSPDEMYRLAVELGTELLDFDRVGIFLLDESRQQAVGTYGTDDAGNVRNEAHIVYDLAEAKWVMEWIEDDNRIQVEEDTDLYHDGEPIGRGWNLRASLWHEDRPIGLMFADNLLSQRPLQSYDADLLFAFGNMVANQTVRKQTEFKLADRIRELNCLADIGYKIDEAPYIPDFLQWVAERIPPAMQSTSDCVAAITYHDQIFGVPEAIELPDQIVQGIRANNEQIGRLYIAYREKRAFLDEESALMGGIVRRVAGYIENQQLIDQSQRALQEANAAGEALQHRADIEKIGTAVSANFLDLPVEEIEAGIDQALQMVGKFAGVDRAYLFRFAEDGSTMSNTNEWCADGIEPYIGNLQEMPTSEFEFLMSYIKKLDIFYAPRVADLPESAEVERTEFQREGIKSIICVPLISYGNAIGFIGFDAVRRETRWYEEDIALLRLVSDIFVSALRRKDTEEAMSKQALELQTVAEVSMAAASIRETDRLLERVVNLTKEQFKLYHAHIYLFNPGRKELELAAGAGEVGRKMVNHKHSIPYHREQSIVARVARNRVGEIVDDVQADPGFLPNPLLPDTNSELAVPLLFSGEMVGVLDLQSDQKNHFTPEDISIQTTLATQVAIALENARSFEQSQNALQELDVLTQRLTLEGWDNYLKGKKQEVPGYIFDGQEALPLPLPNRVEEEISSNGTVWQQELQIHGQPIGRLDLVPEGDDAGLEDEETAALIASVAEQLSARIENIRLTEQMQDALATTETQAYRLSRLNDMAAALNAAENIDDVYQIATDEMLDIIGGDRASITLLNPIARTLTVLSVSGRHAPSQAGATFPLEQEEILARAVREQHVIVQHIPPAEADDNTIVDSIIAPLLSSGQVMGTLNVGSFASRPYQENDENLVRQIAALIASTIDNRRLLSETRARAEQLAAINRISQSLSQYLEQDALLNAAYEEVKGIVSADAFYVSLYTAKTNELWYPILYERGKRLDQEPITINPGDFSYQVLQNKQPMMRHLTPAEVDEIRANSQLIGDPEEQRMPTSLIYIPLISGQRTLGVLSAQSYRYNAYTESDLATLTGVAGYLAVSLENVRFLAEAQQQATQLQRLSEIEIALSQAITEEDILLSVVQGFDKPHTSAMHYIDTDHRNQPQHQRLVANWTEGKLERDSSLRNRPTGLKQDSLTGLWLNNPNNPILIADIVQDDRIDKGSKKSAQLSDFQAAAIIPLRSAGRWQGHITFFWEEPHQFSESESFLANQLVEPIAAVVASRRAQIAQEEALALTDNLYRASRRINAAGPDLQEAITAMAEAAPIAAVNRIDLILFDYDHEGILLQITAAAQWYSGSGPKPAPLGVRAESEEAAVAGRLLVNDDLVIINNTQRDERVGPGARAFYRSFGIPAAVVIPLRIGERQLGSVVLDSMEPHTFTETELEPHLALASQLAVAVDRQRLLRQAEARAERERQIRTITDKIRRGANRESILRVAREEIGQLLGVSTAVAHVGTRDQLLQRMQQHTQSEVKEKAVIMEGGSR